MKVTCPGCQSSYQIDDSKVPEKGIYGRCPKCQERFRIQKRTDPEEILLRKDGDSSEEAARAYLKSYIDAQLKKKQPAVEQTMNRDEIKEQPPHPLYQLFQIIKRNKQKAVLFITACVLILMLIFPPFHLVRQGNDLRLGYAFFTYTHPKFGNFAKIDATMLLVQCLVVAIIGAICWLAFRKEGNSQARENALGTGDIQTIRAEVLTEEDIAALAKPKEPPGVASTIESKSPPSSGPQGVGGWLLFFCVSLTIIGPLYSLMQTVQGWETAAVVSSQFPSFEIIMYLETFGVTVILLYGFVIGCKIWSGNPEGRRLAQQYLKIRLFGFIGLGIIVFILTLKFPSQLIEVMATEIVGALFREGVFFSVWWLYFKKSKRVRNTYGQNSIRKFEGTIHSLPISELTDRQKEKRINDLLYLPWYGKFAAALFFIIGVLGLFSRYPLFGFVGLGLCAFVIWGERLERWVKNR